MSDHDRGAYAPQNEAPLAFETFDARARSGRKPLPMALIGSGIVLLLLATALVMFYRSGSKNVDGVPRPVGGGVAAIKTAPTAEQRQADAGAGLEVYSPQNVPSANTVAPAPQFAPAPEQPMARPAPPPVVAKRAPAPAQIAPAPKPDVKPEVAAKAAPKPETAEKATTAHSAVAQSTPVPTPAPAKTAASSKAVAAEGSIAGAKTVSTTAKTAPTAAATATAAKSAAAKTVAAPKAKPSVAAVPSEDLASAGDTSSTGVITTPLHSGAATSSTVKVASAKAVPAKKVAAPVSKALSAEDEDSAPSLPKGALAAAKPAPSSSSASKGAYLVQVGAFPSAADADKGFARASAKVGGAIAGKSKHVETVQKDGKTFYRSTVKGFSSKSDAAAFCASLRAKGGQCIVRGAGA